MENVWDRVRDASAPGGTRLVGPVPARIPVAVTFYAHPFDEPVLFRIASAYELATKHRVPPEGSARFRCRVTRSRKTEASMRARERPRVARCSRAQIEFARTTDWRRSHPPDCGAGRPASPGLP